MNAAEFRAATLDASLLSRFSLSREPFGAAASRIRLPTFCLGASATFRGHVRDDA